LLRLRPPPHKQEAKIFPRLSFSYSYYKYNTNQANLQGFDLEAFCLGLQDLLRRS